MARIKILITVTTYPLPSTSYDELVCTAGIKEDGEWIRIYPIPFRTLTLVGSNRFRKYHWIELDLQRKHKDFRPESYSPKNVDLSDLKILGNIGTDNGTWRRRKKYCLNNVYTSMSLLISDSKAPQNLSLATFKPTEVLDFIVENDKREWKKNWIEQRKQLDLFIHNEEDRQAALQIIDKIPYKFKYVFKDDEGKIRKLMIEDWEVGQLYRNCLKSCNGNESEAIKKVKQKYKDNFINNKELYFFLGTTKQWHQRRANNPFVIIGVFYPKKETGQLSLFDKF
ncbi:MAG: hypothetical protein ACPGVB_12395 [Chitinophagales bacterium]